MSALESSGKLRGNLCEKARLRANLGGPAGVSHSELDKALSKKVGYSEVVGSKLMMYSDSTKAVLLAELDLPQGGSTDVRINGQSIVADGVADIQYATADKAGVVCVESPYGVAMRGGKTLCINYATESQVAQKSNYYCPITPAKIDVAVRAGLLSNSQITDADKPQICETLGAVPVKTWRDIEYISLRDVTSDNIITRVSEPDGKPYNFRSVRYVIAIDAGTTVGNYGMVSMDNSGTRIANFEHGTVSNPASSLQYVKGIFSLDDSVGNFYSRWDSTGSGYTQVYSRVPFTANYDLSGGLWFNPMPITKITFPPFAGTGVRIRIQAIDY